MSEGKSKKAFANDQYLGSELEIGGEYRCRRDGEADMLNPSSIAKIQQSVCQKSWERPNTAVIRNINKAPP